MRWKNRDAIRLNNGTIEAVVLRGGGHLAELRLVQQDESSPNLLWEAPWVTADPGSELFGKLSACYGGSPAGPFLAGFTGHALCLDTFGTPSEEGAARGIPLHGEASAQVWTIEPTRDGCTADVELPSAQLRFTRTISLAEEQSVLFVEERLENFGPADREVHWVQHVTFGSSLLEAGCSSVYASVDRCRTWPLGYENRAALPNNTNFDWPEASTVDGAALDLRIPFQREGTGFIVAARVRSGSIASMAAINGRLGVALIYCFRREDFPWITIWEENGARSGEPWNGTTQVRGMEFGTTPMPLGREAIQAMGPLFETPVARRLPIGSCYAARFAVCLAGMPKGCKEIHAIDLSPNALVVTVEGQLTIPAEGIQEFLSRDRME